MKRVECEILAPAGRAADIAPLLENGADAVYCLLYTSPSPRD